MYPKISKESINYAKIRQCYLVMTDGITACFKIISAEIINDIYKRTNTINEEVNIRLIYNQNTTKINLIIP